MKPKIKDKLKNFRHGFFREKYRFDQGNAFLVFLNFALLVASLVKQNGGNADKIPLYISAGFFGTWLLGFILDRIVKVQDIQEKISLKRSPIWQENFNRHDNLDEKITKAHQKIDDVEKLLIEIKKDLNN